MYCICGIWNCGTASAVNTLKSKSNFFSRLGTPVRTWHCNKSALVICLQVSVLLKWYYKMGGFVFEKLWYHQQKFQQLPILSVYWERMDEDKFSAIHISLLHSRCSVKCLRWTFLLTFSALSFFESQSVLAQCFTKYWWINTECINMEQLQKLWIHDSH